MPSASAESPATPPRRPPRVAIDAFYAGSVYAAAVPWWSEVRANLFMTIHEWGPTFLYGTVGYAFGPATDVATSEVTLHLSRHTVTATLGIAYQRGSWRVATELGPALAVTSRSDSSTTSGFTPTADDTLATAGVVARAVGSFALGDHWQILLSAGASAFPAGQEYLVHAQNDATVVSPYAVQPEAAAGLGYALW